VLGIQKHSNAFELSHDQDRNLLMPPAVLAILLAVCALPVFAASQVISPGLWQISVQSQSVLIPLTMPPVQVQRCVKAEDAKDPSAMLGGVSSRGASNCTYSDKGYSGNTFHFAMQCEGALSIHAQGEVAFTATTINGTVDSSSLINGQPIQLRNAVSAQRIGECPAETK
jgi:hypothetical protein